jgi:hypothetical protein
MEAQHVPSFWDKLIPEMENNRFGTVSIVILIIGCIGGITVSQGAYDSWIQLSILIVPLMVTVVMLLAVLPMRWIMNAMVVTVLVDVAVLLFNIFS